MGYSIEPAFLFNAELTRLIVKAGTELENQWFFFDGAFTSASTLELSGFNSWAHENFVVVSDQKIIAYFEGQWSRPMDIISGFRLILFDKQYSLTMTRAIMDFLDYLFCCRGCQAFNWTVAVKNEHAYRIYEKFIKNHCGHRVGLRHHAQKSYAGEISDIVLYEITKDEYLGYKERRCK